MDDAYRKQIVHGDGQTRHKSVQKGTTEFGKHGLDVSLPEVQVVLILNLRFSDSDWFLHFGFCVCRLSTFLGQKTITREEFVMFWQPKIK